MIRIKTILYDLSYNNYMINIRLFRLMYVMSEEEAYLLKNKMQIDFNLMEKSHIFLNKRYKYILNTINQINKYILFFIKKNY